MKRILAALLALTLALTLAATAAAGPAILYTVRDGVKAYADRNTSSVVLRTFSRGEAIQVEAVEEGWYATLVQNPGGDDMVLGWIPAADLATTPPCNHQWGEWIISKAPTCTSKGQRIHICQLCNKSETQTIDKLPHSYGDWVILRDATCTSKGLKARWCIVCGYETTREIDKLPHNYGPWSVTTEATDHSAGVETHICLDCGHIQTRSFDPEGTLRRGDKGPAVKEIQNLLVDQGYLKESKADGSFGGGTEEAIIKFQKDQGLTPDGVAWPETIRRLHHDYGDWMVVTALSRYTDGERIRVCRECGYTQHKITKAVPSFSRGDKGNGIKAVQRMLTELGFKCGQVDGSFGGKLETGWEAFALENGITPEFDRLRPGDLDILMKEWLCSQPEGVWKGQGDKDSPVNLILTVAPVGEEDGLFHYTWMLSNLGGEKCRFLALMISPDQTFDTAGDNMVLVLDNARLKANRDNRLNGSFGIPVEWLAGGGTPYFCAIAASDEVGSVWASNAVAAR